MDVVIAVVVLAIVVVAFLVARRARGADAPSAPRDPWAREADLELPSPSRTVTLPIDAEDPDDPSVRRLAYRASERVFRTSPEAEEVVVENRHGVELAVLQRPERLDEPATVGPEVSGEPDHGSMPGEGYRPRNRSTPLEDDDEPTVHTVAKRFELPEAVHARIHDQDSLVDIVRAILEAGGHATEVDGNVLRTGDLAIVLLGEAWGSSSDALGNAFLRFQRSGAARGLILTLGFIAPREIERRQALAPNVRYGGPHTVQRMADAVAVGGDPIELGVELD